MASTIPFMAGSSYDFHYSSPMFVNVQIWSFKNLLPLTFCSIRHPMVISEPVKSTAWRLCF
ncbi:unnamed protein product [Brassica oleracea var. botrytis]